MNTLALPEIKPLFTENTIQKRIKEIAEELNNEYKNEEVFVICVLRGAVLFGVDLVKHLTMPVNMDFIRLSSYGSGYASSGKVKAVDIALPDLNDKNVIVVEDIIDTGYTAQFISTFINGNFKVKSYKFIPLLDKKCRREVDINPDLYGFDIDDKFIVGYGLDLDGYYRNLNYVGYIET